MNERIIVLGCGGHARSMISVLKHKGYQNILCVDQYAREDESVLGVRACKYFDFCENDLFIIAIGNNRQRRNAFQKLMSCGIHEDKILSLVADTAVVCEEVQLEKGIFVANGAFLGPCVKIGRNSIINTHSIIEHETVIGEHSHVAPGSTICGRCIIGDEVMIGAGSTIKDRIYICSHVTIGAGATVVTDIQESGIYVGTPARKIKEYEG